jgi:hypothetical protein
MCSYFIKPKKTFRRFLVKSVPDVQECDATTAQHVATVGSIKKALQQVQSSFM